MAKPPLGPDLLFSKIGAFVLVFFMKTTHIVEI